MLVVKTITQIFGCVFAWDFSVVSECYIWAFLFACRLVTCRHDLDLVLALLTLFIFGPVEVYTIPAPPIGLLLHMLLGATHRTNAFVSVC